MEKHTYLFENYSVKVNSDDNNRKLGAKTCFNRNSTQNSHRTTLHVLIIMTIMATCIMVTNRVNCSKHNLSCLKNTALFF